MTDAATPVTGVAQVSTVQMVAAMAASLLPLAGPGGLIASDVLIAGEQLMERMKASAAANGGMFTIADLTECVTGMSDIYAKLVADRATQKAAEDATKSLPTTGASAANATTGVKL